MPGIAIVPYDYIKTCPERILDDIGIIMINEAYVLDAHSRRSNLKRFLNMGNILYQALHICIYIYI